MARVVDLLQYLLEERGSDLLVKVGSPPCIRRNGRLERTTLDPLDSAAIEQLASELLPPEKAAEFQADGETDLAHSVPGLGRFRVNVYRQRGSVSLAIRRVVPGAPAIADLGVPPVVADLAAHRDGLVLISGPAASGKTTTAAAMIDHINASQARHIVTIEDPIEVLHADRMAIVSQREVGADTPDVSDALRRVSRQDADVVFVSELPDAAAVSGALSAAASGRLVLAVMNTLSATDTIATLVDRFEPHQQGPVRQTLGRVLRGVICQRLVDRSDGRGRVAVVESLVGTQKVRDAIAANADPAVLERLMTEGDYHGMATFDQALLQLFNDEYVTLDEALERASYPEDFRIAVQAAGLATIR
ncbi:PilT/PilU family type 4a pilus ATPase [Aquihabitans sp. G128]|uniref:type IV pilus twitching motility protein PilT n=1 Tax=Aquihabitans sp. G128 TaxID=2849779 RepID=UPI001C246D48|nr:PilT/PilU family type 4a pilus ATPase [Aquihabitans sp. G128]QXC59840.1 PilT/PilU family type 4a pilus ATPase [Aquihabitans sp. G128]